MKKAALLGTIFSLIIIGCHKNNSPELSEQEILNTSSNKVRINKSG